MKKHLKLIGAILLCQLAGIIGSLFTHDSVRTWYITLQKPWFTPPSWAFGPVWITLYFLMGVSLYLVLEKKLDKIAISVFSIQLVLNASWSYLFFGLQAPFIAFIEILVLWVFILLTIVLFYKVDKRAAYLLVPYIVWVTIATFLNYYIWVLNV